MSMDRRFGKLLIRAPFDKRERESIDVSGVDDDPESHRFSRTKQSFKDECDVNLVMKRFERTGVLDHLNEFQGQYGDFTDVPQSYHEAVNQVMAAQDMFMTVPPRIRAMFENDPGQFLAFVQDPANLEEMVQLGLATQPEAVQNGREEMTVSSGTVTSSE